MRRMTDLLKTVSLKAGNVVAIFTMLISLTLGLPPHSARAETNYALKLTGTGTYVTFGKATGPNGYAVNGPTWMTETGLSPAPIGNYSLQFNSANTQRVTFGRAPELGASMFTLEVWFKRTGAGVTTGTGTGGLTAAVPLVTKGRGEAENSNADMNYFFGIDTSGVLAADFEECSQTQSGCPATASNATQGGQNFPVKGTTAIQNNIWYHGAVTFDGRYWKLYLNGNLETMTGADTGATRYPRWDSIQHAGLGTAMTSAGTAAGYFTGILDEARVWNYARTQAEIQSTMHQEVASSPGLIGRWGMNEGSGTTVADTAQPATLGASTFTLETWFQRTGAGTPAYSGSGGVTAVPLLTKGMGEADGSNLDMNYFLGIDSTTGVLVADFEDMATGGNHPVSGVTAIAVGTTWHHAAATYDGGTWKLYLDGNLEQTLAVPGNPVPRWDSLQHASLGSALQSSGSPAASSGIGPGYFYGALDEARIWNYARTQAEILSTINQEIITAPGLLGRWGLNEGAGTAVSDSSGNNRNGVVSGSSYLWQTGAPFNIPLPTPPAAPSGLNATAASAYQINLTWTDNANNESSFEIERAHDVPGPFVSVATVGANTVAYVDATVAAATQYCYRVRAVNGIGASDYSNIICAMTQAENLAALSLGNANAYVTFGDANALDLTQFTLETWFRRDGPGDTTTTGTSGVPNAIPLIANGAQEAENTNADINYVLCIDNSTGALCADFEEGATGVNPGLNHPVIGVTPIATGQWYHAAVTYDGVTWRLYLNGSLERELMVGRPVNAANISATSLATMLNTTNVTNGFFEGVLDEVRIWSVALSQAEIANNINSQITAPQTGLVARWGLNEGAGTTVNGTAGTMVNGTVTGSGSAWVTPGAPFDISFAPPSTPSGLNASAPSNTQMYLTWTDNSNNESSFQIERSTDGGANFAPAGTAVANAVSFTDNGLTASTQYCYRVRAENLGGASDYSNTACATTRAEPAYALDFGSASAYVTFGDAAALELTQFTLETWFRRDGAGTTTTTGSGGVANAIPLISNGAQEVETANADINYVLCIDNSTGALCADFEEGAAGAAPSQNHPVIGVTPIVTGQWYHAAVTYDGTTWRLYLNGMLERELAVGQPVNAANVSATSLATMLNSTNVTNGFFDGVLDEVRIWDFARTQAEIRSTINSELSTAHSGLVGRWSLDEGSGTAVNGSAGTTTNGTITGSGSAWVSGAPFNLNFNLAPDAPTLVSPANAATGVPTSPALTVNVSDPESEALTVSFYGREKNAVGADFTLVVIPDPQYYASTYPAIYNAQMQWVADNKASNNIVYVASLGDNVDTASNTTQWDRAVAAYQILSGAGVPFGLTLGNHDGAPSGTANFNAYFGATLAAQSTYGGRYNSDYDNHYALFEASGMPFIIIFIEYDDTMTTTSHPVLVWANGLLQTYVDRRGIVITHNLLQGGSNAFTTQGQTIYNALRANPNLFLMMGGHLDIAARRTDVYNGNTIYSLRSDYQTLNSQQSGYLRVMRFSPADNTIYVNTYSPWLNKNYDGSSLSESIFSLPYSLGGSASFNLIGMTSVASGANASVTWPGLANATEYEWYATVSDGNKTTTGATWGFTTGSGNAAPVAANDSYSTNQDTALAVSAPGVLTNDTDTELDLLTAVKVTDPAHGTLALNADGAFTYTPNTCFSGEDTFTYKANDSAADSNVATVTLTVNLVNQPPTANAGGPYTADLGSSLALNGNASSDPNAGCGDYIVSYQWLIAGTLMLTGPTPTLSAAQMDGLGVGAHSVQLTVTDAHGATGTAMTSLTIYDNRPFAHFTTNPNPATCGQSITFDASGSSHGRPDRSIVSYQWDFGDGSRNETGQIIPHVYPAFGDYTARLTVTDDNLPPQTASSQMLIEVSQGNQPPNANAGGPYTVDVGNALVLDGAASTDPDASCGDSIAVYEWLVAGAISLTGPTPSLTAAQIDALGVGSHQVQLTVTDEFGATGTAQTTLTINGNGAPVAADDNYTTEEGTTLFISAPGVLGNDSDSDNDNLTAELNDGPAHGSLTLNADGSFMYTPNAGFIGVDAFTYHANDGQADSAIAAVSITVTKTTPPPVLPSSFWGEIHITDHPPAVGGSVTVFASGAPVAATIIGDNGGVLTYSVNVPGDDLATPAKEGGVESEALTFKIGDRTVASATWHSATNTHLDFHPPQPLLGGPYVGYEGAAIMFTGSANDVGADAVTFQWDWENDGVYDQPGSAASHTWPDEGTQTVALQVMDAQGGEGAATVVVTILNMAPTVQAGADAAISEGGAFTGLGAFTDLGADSWTASVDYGDGSGPQALALNPDKTFNLSHLYADNGEYTVTITITDNDGGSGADTLMVSVADVPPTANAGGPYAGTAGQAVTLTGVATCAPVDVCAYAWVLDGETLGTEPVLIHAWNAAGAYVLTFRVTDEDGSFATSQALVSIGSAHHPIALTPGWNLVSFNLLPASTAIADVLASVATDYDLVYAWDAPAAQWLKYDPTAAPFVNTLTTLDHTRGFWIHMTEAGTLDVAGNLPVTTDITLHTGWNLVGYPSQATRALPGALSGYGVADFALVYAYRANDVSDPWKLFDPAAFSNDLTAFAPGWGYWVKGAAVPAQTWTVPYLAP